MFDTTYVSWTYFKYSKLKGPDHGDRGSRQAEEDGGEPGAQGQEEEPAQDEAVEDQGNVEANASVQSISFVM